MSHRLAHGSSQTARHPSPNSRARERFNGVFAALAHDHDELFTLLMRVKMTTDPRRRRLLFGKVRVAIMAHEKAELLEVFDAAAVTHSTPLNVQAHRLDADRLARMVDAVQAADPAAPSWSGLLDRLIELLEHHVDEEETLYMPMLQRALLAGDTYRLLAGYNATKASVMKQLAGGD